jgi:hypothetical protein
MRQSLKFEHDTSPSCNKYGSNKTEAQATQSRQQKNLEDGTARLGLVFIGEIMQNLLL